MGQIDVAAIKATYPVSAVVASHGIQLYRHGTELRACCPFHNEDTPSFTVNDNKGFFHCFGCDAHGDAIDFEAKITRVDFREAAKRLATRAGIPVDDVPSTAPRARPQPVAPAPVAPAAPAEDVKDQPIAPVPHDAPEVTFRHPRHGTASRTWAYRDASGALLGYVCRFDKPDGHKEIVPRCYTAAGWKWVSFAKPRPLYGLDALAANPNVNVIVVEGEKACDAARGLFPQAVVVTWPGGGKAVKHTDWAPLRGRKVVIWPDLDRQVYPPSHADAGRMVPALEQPGMVAALNVAAALDGIAAGVRIAEPPSDVTTDGWDAADAVADGWTPARAIDWLQSALRTPAQLRQPTAPIERQIDEDAPPPIDDGSAFMGDARDEIAEDDGQPFQCLGHDHGDYYYLARGARQVIRLSGAAHTKSNLLMLAPLQWWEMEYATKKGADWDAAANALIRLSERAGIYDPMRVRGRGAWWDDGHAVLHLGDRLVANGAERDVCHSGSRYIYEAAPPLRVNTRNPLKVAESVELVNLCKLLSWERPIHAQLIAGWCVIAPICGALQWRPHIWITGGAGTGKTWVYEHILSRCLGDIALAAASETTEAGLRQALGSDARPVIFDEAEGETAKAQGRIQNVMALMRQASSESSASIYKGTTSGEGAVYRPRSCFAFASIGVGVQQHADQTRVTVLTLVVDPRLTKEDRAARFKAIQEKWHATLTAEFVERLHARTVSLIPVIRKNAETFAVAGASVIGTRRLGDQLGALLAGVYALHSNREISLADAHAWLERQDWTDESQAQEDRDEIACARTILQHVLSVQVVNRAHGSATRHERSIGELIQIAAGILDTDDRDVPPSVADDALLRVGIRVKRDSGSVEIANNHRLLARVLTDTPWAKNWGRILKRIDDAKAGPPTRLGGSSPVRVTEIPLPRLFGE